MKTEIGKASGIEQGIGMGVTLALVLRMAMISSSTYCRVRMMTNRSSRSTGMPCGDIMSVPRICITAVAALSAANIVC